MERCQKKTRHTAHLDGFPATVRIVRPRHPLEGRSLGLAGWMRRRRQLELIVVLADGSTLLVLAGWTDLEGHAEPPAAGTLGRWRTCWQHGGCWIACCGRRWRTGRDGAPSWPTAMIPGGTTRAMQLRLDLAESPAPAEALWELVGVEERQAAIAQLSALIAGAVVGPVVEVGGERAALRDAEAPRERDD